MLKQVVLAHFELVAISLGSWDIPKCLENGPFWDQKWVKNGSKTRFFKSDPGPFGMLKQVFSARFESVLAKFDPFLHMYAPPCALRPYLRALWWSHLELGEGCRSEDIYIYIYIRPLIYTPLPYSTWLHSKVRAKGTTCCIYVAEGTKLDQIGPRNGLKTLVCAPRMFQDHFWKNVFLTNFSPIFAPETAPFQGISGFPRAKTCPNGLQIE